MWGKRAFIALAIILFVSGCYRVSRVKNENDLFSYLKVLQDNSSTDQKLLPSMEDNISQTFNNSLGAMCFVLKDERERAERILDFYSNACEKDNSELKLQNFFYKGEARGFYQYISINNYYTPWDNDRWIGDMAWLLIAYKYYEKKYNSDRYKEVANLLKDLLVSFYKDDPNGNGGYVQHGWRKGDSKLHENTGHHEGNIDCYVALKMCGEDESANKIKLWIDSELKDNKSLPLDLYSWSVLAFGRDNAYLLDIPEQDERYRKEVVFNDNKVTGFFSFPSGVSNIWVDGTAHMACAYRFAGNENKYNFYKEQLDKMIIKRNIYGNHLYALPYTLNKQGGYDWVDVNKGFVSCVVWYIFAQEDFNPFLF